jgi:hypothetical protein
MDFQWATGGIKIQKGGMMTKTVEKQAPRKDWQKPELRSVVPAARTRGGGGDINDADDIFYDAS